VESLGIRIEVRLTPRAPRDEIAGWRGGRLVVRVTAPPVDDRANAALCRLIAKRAGVPRSGVSVVTGGRSRDKVVEVSGLDALRRRASPAGGLARAGAAAGMAQTGAPAGGAVDRRRLAVLDRLA
jgi:uncharacterized protein (TIGR00251 family)